MDCRVKPGNDHAWVGILCRWYKTGPEERPKDRLQDRSSARSKSEPAARSPLLMSARPPHGGRRRTVIAIGCGTLRSSLPQ